MQIFEILPDGEKEIIVPPVKGAFRLERCRVTGVLNSTRTGKSNNWCSSPALSGMGKAPFEPALDVLFLDAVVQALGWPNPSHDPKVDPLPFVSWGGTGVNSPCLVYASEAVDLTRREERAMLIQLAENQSLRVNGPVHMQGHLAARWVAPTPTADLPDPCNGRNFREIVSQYAGIFYHPNRPVSLFDHHFFCDTVVGLDNHRLVRNPGVVTSFSHIREPLFLDPGWWLFTHPFPERGGVD